MNQADGNSNDKVIDLAELRKQKEGADGETQQAAGEGAAEQAAPQGPFAKPEAMVRLREAEEIYSLLSPCTKLPYVCCDAESYDDEVLVFFDAESAQEAARELIGKRVPVGVLRVENAQKLSFFSNLYTMGVNALLLKQKGAEDILIQLPELVMRRTPQSEEGKIRVENPSLVLTSIYYAQETRKPESDPNAPHVKELQEEMLADFRRGVFIVALDQNTKNTPLLKLGEEYFHPVFTDIQEFSRFNREGTFAPAVLKAVDLPKQMAPNAKGVVVNPLGVNIVLNLGRNANGAAQPAPNVNTQAAGGARISNAEASSIVAQAAQAAAMVAARNAAAKQAQEPENSAH